MVRAWCGAESPFGNGVRHRLTLMVVAVGCAFRRRPATAVADADNHRYLLAAEHLWKAASGGRCRRGRSPILARRWMPLPLFQRRAVSVAVVPTRQTAPRIIP